MEFPGHATPTRDRHRARPLAPWRPSRGNSMDAIYPAGPASVPANLTAPTAAYKRHAWLAMAGLAAFLVAYFGLLGWFGWTAWRLFSVAASSDRGEVGAVFVGGCALFLAV